VDASRPISIGDADLDGRPDLTVSFKRAAVQSTLTIGEAVPITVRGRIGGGCFETTDRVRVTGGFTKPPKPWSASEIARFPMTTANMADLRRSKRNP
jgi:hypothetical protein